MDNIKFTFVFTFNRLATGCTVRGLNPGGGRDFSVSGQTAHGAHPVYCKMGTGYLFRRHMCRGGAFTNRPNLEPRLKEEQSYKSAPAMCLHGLFSIKPYLYLHATMSGGRDTRRSCISAASKSLPRYKYFLLQPIFPDVVEQKRGYRAHA